MDAHCTLDSFLVVVVVVVVTKLPVLASLVLIANTQGDQPWLLRIWIYFKPQKL